MPLKNKAKPMDEKTRKEHRRVSSKKYAGADAPINVQAAHLRCNLSKNAGGGGQLRLIG